LQVFLHDWWTAAWMHRLVKDWQQDIVSLQASSESEINKILLYTKHSNAAKQTKCLTILSRRTAKTFKAVSM